MIFKNLIFDNYELPASACTTTAETASAEAAESTTHHRLRLTNLHPTIHGRLLPLLHFLSGYPISILHQSPCIHVSTSFRLHDLRLLFFLLQIKKS
jgi:hypothetical protein